MANNIAANAAHMLRMVAGSESRNKYDSCAIEFVNMPDIVDVVHKALCSQGESPFVDSLNGIVTNIHFPEYLTANDKQASVEEYVAHIVKRAVEDLVILGRSNVKLNAFQINVLRYIVNTTQHLVVCTPTRSGKTMAFDFLIVAWRRDVQRAIDEQGSSLSDFAVVITVPGRELAEEQVAHYKKIFPDLVVVRFIADDDYMSTNQANIIVSTYAKAQLAFVRNRGVASRTRLLIIDEAHKLHDDSTGPSIECMLAAAALSCPDVRVVLMSATLYNIDDVVQGVKDALGSNDVTMLSYGLDYRPLPLDIVVATGTATNVKPYPGASEKPLNALELLYLLTRKLWQQYGCSKTLLFCTARTLSEKMSNYMTHKIGAPSHTRPFNESRLATCSQSTRDTIAHMRINRSCKRTKAMLKGVPSHHAGLIPTERLAITELLTSGTVNLVSCTTTLSHGVNVGAEENSVRARGVIIAESTAIADEYYASISTGVGTTIESQMDKADGMSAFITDMIYLLAERKRPHNHSVVTVKIRLEDIFDRVFKSFYAACLRNRVGRHNLYTDTMTPEMFRAAVNNRLCAEVQYALQKCKNVGQVVTPNNWTAHDVVSLTTVGQIAIECRLSPDTTRALSNAAVAPFADEVNKSIYYALAGTDDCKGLVRGCTDDEEESVTATIRSLMQEQFVFVMPTEEDLASSTGVLVVIIQAMIALTRFYDPTLRALAEDLCLVIPRLLVALKRFGEVNGNWELITMSEALQSMFKTTVIPMYC